MSVGTSDFVDKITVEHTGLGFESAGIWLVKDTTQRTPTALVTDYLKNACILPNYAIVADPTGTMVSYEGGYTCMALIEKAGAGEVDLAKACLDEFVKLQRADGSWCQQFRPERTAAGLHVEYEDRQVDSGASLLAHAMAMYDASVGAGSTVYKEPVRKAFGFLREAQYAHMSKYPSNLLCNQRLNGVWNYTALLADCAEALLAAPAALDQYGTDLTTPAGYSIKTFANDLCHSIWHRGWTGDGDSYFRTEWPPGETVWELPKVMQGISFTQGLCALAVWAWQKSAHNTLPDYTGVCEKALDWITALAQGKWGGFYYAPVAPGLGDYYDEFPVYTAQVVRGLEAVNPTKYARAISRGRRFIQLCALPQGEVFNLVHINGRLDQADMGESGEGWMHFRCLNSALGLLAGA